MPDDTFDRDMELITRARRKLLATVIDGDSAPQGSVHTQVSPLTIDARAMRLLATDCENGRVN